MSSQIPYCGPCRQARNTESVAIRSYKAARRKGKGKAKADWDDGATDTDSGEDDEWGGGEPGIMKPDITFFGQALDSKFDECLFRDREEVDLLVIIGTSLKVAPVSEVLSRSTMPLPFVSLADSDKAHIPHSVPQLLINLTPLSHVHPDVSYTDGIRSSLQGLTSCASLDLHARRCRYDRYIPLTRAWLGYPASSSSITIASCR